jgi:hypothetical protein
VGGGLALLVGSIGLYLWLEPRSRNARREQ